MRHFLIAITLFSAIHNCHAALFDGNNMKAWFEASDRVSDRRGTMDDMSEAMIMLGYIASVIDLSEGRYICGAARIPMSQSVAIVRKYVEANPTQWSMSAAGLTFIALSTALPCKK